jgi:hypothetical protein
MSSRLTNVDVPLGSLRGTGGLRSQRPPDAAALASRGGASSATASGSAASTGIPAAKAPSLTPLMLQKIIDELRRSQRPMSSIQIEHGCGIRFTKEIERELQTRDRDISYDPVRKLYSFKSAYSHLQSKEALDGFIQQLQRPLGFEVKQDLLESHDKMKEWIEELLKSRSVRAIRHLSTVRKLAKCINGETKCSLYGERCDECKTLDGIVLFPVAEREAENVIVSDDIRQRWRDVCAFYYALRQCWCVEATYKRVYA